MKKIIKLGTLYRYLILAVQRLKNLYAKGKKLKQITRKAKSPFVGIIYTYFLEDDAGIFTFTSHTSVLFMFSIVYAIYMFLLSRIYTVQFVVTTANSIFK